MQAFCRWGEKGCKIISCSRYILTIGWCFVTVYNCSLAFLLRFVSVSISHTFRFKTWWHFRGEKLLKVPWLSWEISKSLTMELHWPLAALPLLNWGGLNQNISCSTMGRKNKEKSLLGSASRRRTVLQIEPVSRRKEVEGWSRWDI